MVSRFSAYDEGGPNDPRTAFNGLRQWLTAVKEELSPWGWQAYDAEFRERMKAEKKLLAMNNLPDSGAEPKDGVVQGTPLWQERLDQMLLVEHLKKKVMTAHTAFVEATDLLLKSHAWLVRDSLLADKFAECISRVPPSQHDRIDLLQMALKQSREETKQAKDEFNEYKVRLQTLRQEYLQRTMEHQAIAIRRRYKDDILMTWRYAAERGRAQDLASVNAALCDRVQNLETAMAGSQEDLEEASRQWDEQRAALEADRDEYKRLYEKFLRAHEQAMADLEQSQGTAEDQAKMLQVLTVEKHRLTGLVEELEDDKKRMAKQLSDLRDEVAKLKADLRRLGGQLRQAETALLVARTEAQTLRADVQSLEDIPPPDGEGPARPSQRRLLQDTARREAELLDKLKAAEQTAAAQRQRLLELEGPGSSDANPADLALAPASKIGILPYERRLRAHVEQERDVLLSFTRDLDHECVQVKENAFQSIEAIKLKASKELNDFKTVELGKVRDQYQHQIDSLTRRCEILMKEVAVGDSVGPHLPTLNPLGLGEDSSKMCSICRRTIVFEGTIKT